MIDGLVIGKQDKRLRRAGLRGSTAAGESPAT
jgi:hypothetical protein